MRAALADGFGWARRLDAAATLDTTLREFLAFDGPALLEVMVDPDAAVYPMVGPGATYADMRTGDFIAARAPVVAPLPAATHAF